MFNFIKNTYQLAGDRRSQLTQGIIFTVLKNFSQLLVFVAIYLAFSNLQSVTDQVIWQVIVICLVSFGLHFLNNYLLNRKIAGIYFDIFRDYRLKVGEKLKKAPMGYFSQQNLSGILSALTIQMRSLENFSAMAFDFTVSGLSLSLFVLLGIWGLNWRVGAVALGFLILAWMCVFVIFNIAQREVEREHRAIDGLSQDLTDGIRGSMLLRSFPKHSSAISSQVHDKVSNSSKNLLSAQTHFETIFILFSRLFIFTLNIGSVILILYTVYLYLQGIIPASKVLTISAMGFLLLQGLLQLQNAGVLAAKMPALQRRLEEVLTIPVMPDGELDKVENLDIEFEHVSFGYVPGREIIHDLSFRIPKGSKVAIVGPSGAGKTTIINLIARFYDPTSGTIYCGGQDLRHYKVSSLLGNISPVFQDVYLFNDTVENNIRFGCPEASDEMVIEVSKRANCHEFIMDLPEGYETQVGEGGTRFSGGEKQRISIARALLKNAELILLDEATSSVDPENEADILSAIEELCRDKTVVTIAHRLSTVRNADLILVIDQGRLVQSGAHEDLLAVDGIYRRFIAARESAQNWRMTH